MSVSRSQPARELPPWLALGVSVVVAAHLFTIGILVLAAPSGPWPTNMGPSLGMAPQFAASISEITTNRYLRPLKMTHNYHFVSNRTAVPGVQLDIQLKDASGKVIRTVQLPDKDANTWVRHRQVLLARSLADDQPVQPRAGEVIPAPNQQVATVSIWDMGPEQQLIVRSVPEHLVPRDRPVMKPSPWSELLARSYARHLCRQHGAASAVVLRHTREPIMPSILFTEETPAGAFSELVSNFGEFTMKEERQ